MRLGLALPQYDSSIPDRAPLRWDDLLAQARAAADVGYDSLWLSDHLTLDFSRYRGPAVPEAAFEPLVTLAALARLVDGPRLGTLVLCEALRPAGVLAKALATLDRLCDGRLDVGLGAGWYAPDYQAIGMEMPGPAERLARLRDAALVCRGLLGGGPLCHEGRHAVHDAVNRPAAVQEPHPPIVIGGKGDRLLALAAEVADEWNTCWVWTPDAYAERVAVLDRACTTLGRDPATMRRSVGLYALCGRDERDLARRYERMRVASPGVLDDITLEQWRVGRLVGTVEEVGEQLAAWRDLAVETVIVSPGAVPFQVVAPDDVELLGEAFALVR